MVAQPPAWGLVAGSTPAIQGWRENEGSGSIPGVALEGMKVGLHRNWLTSLAKAKRCRFEPCPIRKNMENVTR